MKIPFKSQLKRFKNIENRNKKFNSMTKEEQRMEIAYDSLMLIIEGILLPSIGHYWSIKLNRKTEGMVPKRLQSFLNNELPVCTVCQRGALMISTIRLGNQVSGFNGLRSNGGPSTMKGFSLTDFNRMENEYEYNPSGHPYRRQTVQKLANICCNVIANGNFEIRDKKDYLLLWEIKL